VDAIADCCTREAAAAAGGVSPSTLFAWLARGRAEPGTPEARLLERVQLAELEAELTLTRDVRAAADFVRERGLEIVGDVDEDFAWIHPRSAGGVLIQIVRETR